MSPEGRSEPLYAGDPDLLNTYAVVADPENLAGLRFARGLVEEEGRAALTDAVHRRSKGFSLWPSGAPRDRPEALPR